MAWTQAQADALRAALASGTKTIQYEDKLITYQSTAEMWQVLAAIEAELGTTSGGRTTLVTFDRG